MPCDKSILSGSHQHGKVRLDNCTNMPAQEEDEQGEGPQGPTAVEVQGLRSLLHRLRPETAWRNDG